MAWIKEFIAKIIIKKEGEKMFGKLFERVNGYKTYITLSAGVAVAVIGYFWGPLQLAGIDIPKIESSALWKIIWEAFAFAFLRNGVSKVASKE